ncbi:MAG: DUF4198 domain-containing protein [Campylobacterales bacterium]|nr:DUF4198 domain-containing protein [Campylobacterales bacterium]
MRKVSAILAVCVGLALPAMAHQLWLERDGDVVKEYFGHWPNFKENSDGKRLEAIKGTDVSPKGVLSKTERAFDHNVLHVNKAGDIGVIEAMEPRKGKLVEFIVRTLFLARHGRSESITLLALDLVPTAPNANTFTLMLEGKPLPATPVKVISPTSWSKTFRSDLDGKVTIETPWKGDYVAEVSYTDKTKGEVDGKPYEQTNYIMTLFFTTNEGAEVPTISQ